MEQLNPFHKESLEILKKQLKSNDEKEIILALRELSHYCDFHYDLSPLTSELIGLTMNTNNDIREYSSHCIYHLAKNGFDLSSYTKELFPLFNDNNEFVRINMIKIYNKLYSHHYDISNALEIIFTLLNDSNEDVAFEAGELLIKNYHEKNDIKTIKEKIINNQTPIHALQGAFWSFHHLNINEEQVNDYIQIIKPFLDHEDDDIRWKACEFFIPITSHLTQDDNLIENLITHLKDPYDNIPWVAAEILTGIYYHQEKYDLAIKLLHHEYETIKKGAILFFDEILSPQIHIPDEITHAIKLNLNHQDFELQKLSAKFLSKYYIHQNQWKNYLDLLDKEPHWNIGKKALFELMIIVRNQKIDISMVFTDLFSCLNNPEFDQYPLEVLKNYVNQSKEKHRA